MANARILVVEDESIVAKNIQNRLKKLGYVVPAVAHSGEEAIRKAGETRPDLVLMDIVLKGDMDGVEAAKQIYACFNIPVIYLTAYADMETIERAKITEPFGYILKPFEIRNLRSTIEIALYKHKMERQLKERKQLLTTTLESIGDAVIATDKNGVITFINPIAETLTGWRQEDALGKDLGEVFNIINKRKRTLIEAPGMKVLREGVVSDLTNYILIAKNEREIPIDVNAAPIQDDKGNISGVVLVFRDITEYKRERTKVPKAEKPQSIKRGHIPIRLMIATSSSLIQEGIRKILKSERGIEITAEAISRLEIIPLVERKKPDILFIDTAMSNLDVHETLKSIKEKRAKTKVLLLLHSIDERFIMDSISLGIRGYLTNTLSAEQFTQAIRAVSKDEIWAEIKIITNVLTRLLPSKKSKSALSNLTKREDEIVKLVVQGRSNKQISRELFVSENTVKAHLVNIFKKLGVSNRLQLALDFQDISSSKP
jgi:PAS domain S-box-containing protein